MSDERSEKKLNERFTEIGDRLLAESNLRVPEDVTGVERFEAWMEANPQYSPEELGRDSEPNERAPFSDRPSDEEIEKGLGQGLYQAYSFLSALSRSHEPPREPEGR